MVNSECSIVNGFSAKGGVFLSRACNHDSGSILNSQFSILNFQSSRAFLASLLPWHTVKEAKNTSIKVKKRYHFLGVKGC